VGKDEGRRRLGHAADADVQRVRAARKAIGAQAERFVDAKAAYSARQAIAQGQRFAEHGVTYFEEPVSSDHLNQLAFVRQQAPMAIAAGEYGYDRWYFRNMLQAGALGILQADATALPRGNRLFRGSRARAQLQHSLFGAHLPVDSRPRRLRRTHHRARGVLPRSGAHRKQVVRGCAATRGRLPPAQL
jgi:hypothetical protein